MSQHITTTRRLVFSSNQTIPERFKAVAGAFPDEPALFFRDKTLTFAELDRLSDQLAQALLRLGVQTGDFVAICLDRSPEMMVAIFAILKAGGAYVPIDVDYPPDRRQFLIKDANAKVLLTQQYLKKRLPDTDAPVIALDADWWRIDRQFDPAKPTQNPVEPAQPAYMIYTSGSTGKPKGVLISHENLMNQLEGQQDIAPAPIGRMILTCSISFDVSVLTIFWALLQGAPLVLPGQGEEKDMEILSGLIARHGVTHLLTLPSLHTLLLDQAPPERLQSLRLVNVSGEVCPTSLAQKHEKLLPDTQLYNLYGPTEATVNCTFFTIPKGFNAPKVPIGKPILNYELFILDEKMREVAPGEVGEIYIGGSKPVVGMGYWNREKLTRERFIANPFRQVRGGSVLYKTGDLGRWLPDGNIEFLGRSDFQVKFKGYRIELGEIETAIAQHLGVRETVVVLKGEPGSEHQKLVAYIVPGSVFELNVNELREFLAVTLPDYMMPTTFVFLEKMPLTTNGKINRAALPDPDHQRPELAQAFEAPETELEVLLSELWANLLGVSPIGRHDKFFELGGTSILAARFIGELQKRMKASVFITTIFDHPTIATYAAFLEAHYADK
ncbi:MAG: amino acid adenylation domain-containing protein, partial [Bacteroidetes bacterium]